MKEMKKNQIKSSILASLITLFLLFAPWWKSGGLVDITKPYLGEYECKQATFGDEDCLQKFSSIILELKEDNTFLLTFREKEKEKRTLEGVYQYDKEKETISLEMGKSAIFKRKFSLTKGRICVSIPFGNKNLTMQFEQR